MRNHIIPIEWTDVLKVSNTIGKNLTEEQIDEIIKRYPEEQEKDMTGSWNLVVEELIYQVLEEQNN